MNRFSALTNIPVMTKGLVRELRVRWTLQEMGLPYVAVVYPHKETKVEPYLHKQPFGQVPYFESDDVCMFETGAILLHLAEKHGKLLPVEEKERARAYTWMFTALNSVEPYMFHYFLLNMDKECPEAVKMRARDIAVGKLNVLGKELGEREYFGGDFSIAEIIMTTVLKTAGFLGLLGEHENLRKFVERNETRPAFQRALKEHEALYN